MVDVLAVKETQVAEMKHPFTFPAHSLRVEVFPSDESRFHGCVLTCVVYCFGTADKLHETRRLVLVDGMVLLWTKECTTKETTMRQSNTIRGLLFFADVKKTQSINVNMQKALTIGVNAPSKIRVLFYDALESSKRTHSRWDSNSAALERYAFLFAQMIMMLQDLKDWGVL
ncbi:hypothetical protein NECAME_10021 [Necator americanus]|uniref:Uncharacterized protein n=1 Tax=Necator americanus TaxID=51031 RepID=W2TBX8_NECAM|nr:hypothetical protein NECAME_10021 [Necator americanus]ETN79104.1 hypothetical protein NECAME_10021 [Necator americanus]